jgi:hypothetical protein
LFNIPKTLHFLDKFGVGPIKGILEGDSLPHLVSYKDRYPSPLSLVEFNKIMKYSDLFEKKNPLLYKYAPADALYNIRHSYKYSEKQGIIERNKKKYPNLYRDYQNSLLDIYKAENSWTHAPKHTSKELIYGSKVENEMENLET